MTDVPARPEPPYYAVIFTSRRREPAPDDGYAQAATRMEDLARGLPGFLGIDSAREDVGITVCYWRDEASIEAWRRHVEHQAAQEAGRERWYAEYTVRVARVERAYGFVAP